MQRRGGLQPRGHWWRAVRATLAGAVVLGAVLALPAGAGAGRPARQPARGPFASAARSYGFSRPVAHVRMNPATRSSIPSPSDDTYLEGVSCPTKAKCWAVGDYETTSGAYLNEVLRRSGDKWSKEKTPQPGGTASGDDNYLTSVACLSASDCWAVGDYKSASGGYLNQALHFNGKKWSLVTTPNPSGTASDDAGYLEGVACLTSSECWAAGYYLDDGADVNEVLHWNGKKWSLATTPNPGGSASDDENELNGVSCASASDCWAVGYSEASGGNDQNEALHWNGKKWSAGTTPEMGGADGEDLLDGDSCATTSSCLAVGYWGDSRPPTNEALRLKAKKWVKLAPPQPGFVNFLYGTACNSAANCWAVGGSIVELAHGEAWLNEVLWWNGHSWGAYKVPNPLHHIDDYNNLNAVSCASTTDCEAIGEIENSSDQDLNEALHWNGKKWSEG